MPGKSTKFDRCVEGVKEKSPSVDNPAAVCVSSGVKPASWKKSETPERELLKTHPNGQWTLEKKYTGFDELKDKLAHKEGVSDPGALAAAIGRKKYGKEAFQSAAAKGKSMKKDDAPHSPESPEDSAHDVVEEGKNLKDEIDALSVEDKKAMMNHLRSLKDKSKLRSEKNRLVGKD